MSGYSQLTQQYTFVYIPASFDKLGRSSLPNTTQYESNVYVFSVFNIVMNF